jgi:hypothetical protein
MTKFFLLFLIALMCAPAALAQNRRDDYSYYEFYVGYAYVRADNDADHFDRNGNATFNGSKVNLANERKTTTASRLSLIRTSRATWAL